MLTGAPGAVVTGAPATAAAAIAASFAAAAPASRGAPKLLAANLMSMPASVLASNPQLMAGLMSLGGGGCEPGASAVVVEEEEEEMPAELRIRDARQQKQKDMEVRGHMRA